MAYSKDLVQERLELFEALCKSTDIGNILKIAYTHLQNPIVLNDSSYQAVHSYGGPLESDVYSQDPSGNFMKTDVLQTLYNERFPDELMRAEHSYLGYQPDRGRYLLLCPIHVDQIMVAFLCVLPNFREHTPEDVAYMDLLADTISIALQRENAFTNNFAVNQGFLIKQILSGYFETEQQLQARLTIMSINPSGQYCLGCVEKPGDSFSAYNQFMHLFKRVFPDALLTVYETKLLILLNGPKDIAALTQKRSELEPFLKFNNLRLTVSCCFGHLMDLPAYYQQIVALQAAQQRFEVPPKPISNVLDDYLFYLMTTEKTPQELSAIIHPDIQRLIEYDNLHGSDHVTTLLMYLTCRHSSDAAQNLHIHKTTLSYRIERIGDILGEGKLIDQELCLIYLLSLRIHCFLTARSSTQLQLQQISAPI